MNIFLTILIIILSQFTVLVLVQFMTSKTGLDIQYNKLGVQVASWVPEQIKTSDLRKLQNIRKTLKLSEDTPYCPVPPPEMNFWQQQSEQQQYKSRKVFLIFFNSALGFSFFQIFCPGL